MKRRRKGKFTEVSSVLGKVLGDLGLEGVQAAFELGERWEEIVGPEIALHCRPIAVRHGVLETEVDSSVWSQQLQLQRPQLIAAMRDVLGSDAPADLRFRVGYSRLP
jgi:predicted nucleic acid-binding Zn ribbon protein